MRLIRDRYHNLSSPLKWSIGIHLAFFVVALIGIPDWFQTKPDIQPPQEIIVDLVTIDDVTSAPNTTREKPKKKIPTPPKPQETKPEPEKKKEKPKMAPKSLPPEEIKASSKPKEKPAPPMEKLKEKPAIIPAAEPEPKKEDDKKEDKPTPDTAEFSSVLKNLVGEEEPEKPEPPKEELKIDAPINKENPVGKAPVVGATVTATEIDLLKKQLARCWNIPIGARNAEGLSVEIDVHVDKDRRVTKADIVDMWRYRSDPFFRTAAESARRALLSPQCSPLALPPEKYDNWKYMRINFNPKEMFGG